MSHLARSCPRRSASRAAAVAVLAAALSSALSACERERTSAPAPASRGQAAPVDSGPGTPGAARAAAEPPATAAGLGVVERVTGGASGTDTLPLIIALHGLGDRPERFLDLFSGYTTRARVVALRAPDAHGPGFSWFPTRAEAGTVTVHAEGVTKAAAQVARAADELVKVRATTGKPIVLGFSQGGMISFALAVQHPGRFAAVHPLAGWLPEALIPQKKDPDAAYPRIVALHGDADDRLPIGPTRAGAARLSALGIAVDFREYAGVGHTLSAKMRADLFEELQSETRRLSCRRARAPPAPWSRVRRPSHACRRTSRGR